jgi:hypothetical protein
MDHSKKVQMKSYLGLRAITKQIWPKHIQIIINVASAFFLVIALLIHWSLALITLSALFILYYWKVKDLRENRLFLKSPSDYSAQIHHTNFPTKRTYRIYFQDDNDVIIVEASNIMANEHITFGRKDGVYYTTMYTVTGIEVREDLCFQDINAITDQQYIDVQIGSKNISVWINGQRTSFSLNHYRFCRFWISANVFNSSKAIISIIDNKNVI